MSKAFPYQFVCIEGNIGAGKTSLCELIQEDYNCQLILEQFSDNPFLPYFYEDPERYAFTVELFFMTERHKQLTQHLVNRDLFFDFTVADYNFWKTLVFARINLQVEEYRLFQRLFQILNSNFSNPDLLVFLHRSPDKLLDNIRKRERSYEKWITKAYLKRIQDSYFEFFKSQMAFPILILDVETLDFVHNPDHYHEVKKLLHRVYLPGTHRISLRL